MSNFVIKGGSKLFGEVVISGAKNASMPILIASILSDKKTIIQNIPFVDDVTNLLSILTSVGSRVTMLDSGMRESLEIENFEIKCELENQTEMNKIRTSILLLGPLLGRNGYAKLSRPGGCKIGERKIDQHIYAMECLGATVREHDTYIEATTAGKKLRGAEIVFPFVSVGATENAITAAVLAEGKTIIKNAAIEPEIQDLISFLNAIGAKITQLDRTITIDGVSELKPAKYSIMPDRIEAATYAIMAAITNGELVLRNVSLDVFGNILSIMGNLGVDLEEFSDSGTLCVRCRKKQSFVFADNLKLATNPYPEFPTDLQPQVMAMLAVMDGTSEITENIFENRLQHVEYLNKMGANISINGNVATIRGVSDLKGARVLGTDLRASAALVTAALVANGVTIVENIEYIDRGYHNIERNLRNCGVEIERTDAGS